MNKKQFILGIFLASLFSASLVVGGFLYFNPVQSNATFEQIQEGNAQFSSYVDNDEYNVPDGINFIYAAEKVTQGVVHIKAEVVQKVQKRSTPFEEFFRDYHGGSPKPQNRQGQSQGSGVIISPDGYIVTNNHVVEGAKSIEVVLFDNREYKADVIGTDPNTDITLLKIDEDNLNFVEFGDSDNSKVGEWVLAVGNPFNLTSTVTAGIVSAKARSINILSGRNRYGVESFIQTDAAVNPGNSGGALVNLKGELIGVNTAIATPTGTFAGYSFAVPSTLVTKVVNDLKEFGEVQRALLGVSIMNLNDPRLNLPTDLTNGIFVEGVSPESAAKEAGIERGDIITKLDDIEVNTVAELQELIARRRPGDELLVTFYREDEKKTVNVVLKSLEQNVEMMAANTTRVIDGALFQNITDEEKETLNIEGGAKIIQLDNGKWQQIGIEEGFIVTAIDKTNIADVDDLMSILQTKRGGVLIEGVYPDGTKAFYGMGI